MLVLVILFCHLCIAYSECYYYSFSAVFLTLSMKYKATALCLILISFDFQSSLYWVRMRSTHFFSRRAVSYFCQSFSPCTNIHRKAFFLIKGMLVKYVTSHIYPVNWWLGLRHNWGWRLSLGTCLYLDPGARIQHDVLDGALDVFSPRCQPGHLVVMANFLPFCPWGRFRVFGVPSEKRGWNMLLGI